MTDETRRPADAGKPMRVLIVDDQALFRLGLGQAVRPLAPCVEVMEADSLVGALEALVRQPFVDLVIAEWLLPDMNGEAGLQRLAMGAGTAPVLVVSARIQASDARRVMEAGARGFIARGASPALLLGAIGLLFAGGAYVPAELLDDEAKDPSGGRAIPMESEGLGALTRRQSEILALVTEGRCNKEIARALGLAEGTVKIHLTRVFKTLGVRSRAQAMALARDAGWSGAVRSRAA